VQAEARARQGAGQPACGRDHLAAALAADQGGGQPLHPLRLLALGCGQERDAVDLVVADHGAAQRTDTRAPAALERVEQSLEAAERGLDAGKPAGQQKALDELGRGLTPVGAPLPQRLQQQLLAEPELTDDDAGKTGHGSSPCETGDDAMGSAVDRDREAALF
jgi:hypothetical protein